MRAPRISAVLGTAAVASVLLTAVVSPASADPAAGTFPSTAGTGSDTTQEVLNALANPSTGSLTNVGSWNATGTPTISVTSGGAAFKRPNGSSAGIKALSRSIDGGLYETVSVTGQLDFARSSRGPKAGTDLGAGAGALTFVPFARDAVSYAYNGSGLGALTVADLKKIYEADTAAQAVIGGVQTHPILPQADSGTRAFFLAAIGVTTVGSFVSQPGVQENQANGVVTTAGQIIPFSVASWIAQYNGKSTNYLSTALAAGTQLGTPVLDVLGDPVAPTEPSGVFLAPNNDFYSDATFGRDVYNVLETARITPGNAKYDSTLVATFAGSTSQIASSASNTIITNFGFQTVPYAGDTDIAGTDRTGDHARGGALE